MKVLRLLALALCPSFLNAAIVFQQSNSCDGCSTLQFTTQNNTVGSTLFAIVRFGDTTSVPGLSDDVNINWSAADVSQAQTTDGHKLWVYHFDNSQASTKATVTVGNFGGSSHRWIILEVTGLASSSSLDKTVSAEGSGVTLNSGATATTSQAVELFLGAGSNSATANTISAGTNIAWTGFVGTVKTASEVFIASSAQAVTAQFTHSSDLWTCIAATYKGAATATAPSARGLIINGGKLTINGGKVRVQ